MSRSKMLSGNILLCALTFSPVLLGAQQDYPENARRVTNRVAPSYPTLARSMHMKGIVKLEVVVAPNGTVKTVKTLGGHPILVDAAERAVQKWRWEPAGHESNEVIELKFSPD
jgi:TonB family protein